MQALAIIKAASEAKTQAGYATVGPQTKSHKKAIMIENNKQISTVVFVILLFSLLQFACSSEGVLMEQATTTITQTNSLTPTETLAPTITEISTQTPTSTVNTVKPSETPIPSPTIDPTIQTWHSTAIAVQKTAQAESDQVRKAYETQVAQFPAVCENINSYYSIFSPDGEWFAASCGYNQDQKLVVQDRKGKKWELFFPDFFSPDKDADVLGLLEPLSWSPSGKQLYFTKGIGYSGGGNQCFSGGGMHGLFRLNLDTGSWSTLIPPNDAFPGNRIKFSPNGDFFAVDEDGILITNLDTYKIFKINVNGIQDMLWSPDGNSLVYSIASCGESTVETSSIYVWNTTTNQSKIIFTTDEMLLRPQYWVDNSTLRFEGEKWIGTKDLYTIYGYDLNRSEIRFFGTATPSP